MLTTAELVGPSYPVYSFMQYKINIAPISRQAGGSTAFSVCVVVSFPFSLTHSCLYNSFLFLSLLHNHTALFIRAHSFNMNSHPSYFLLCNSPFYHLHPPPSHLSLVSVSLPILTLCRLWHYSLTLTPSTSFLNPFNMRFHISN